MENTRYAVWFLTTVALAILALMGFNAVAGAYVLHHPAGGSTQTLSGFERALKPVWLEQIQPDLVFVGSSRVRDGFDPVLIDPAFTTHSFNYGASSITPYEARRFVQDALAHASVKQIVVGLDAFTGNGGPGEALPGFDETRLAVTPSGDPTPRRSLWLFTTRYLSGGALGMNALAAWSLAQLKDGQTAADRADIFPAYAHMTEAVMQKDLAYRRARIMRMGDGAAQELSTTLAAACQTRARLTLFFPPDNMAIIARYRQGDAASLDAFKQKVRDLVALHNARCKTKAALFDFMAPNQLTRETLTSGSSPDYVDLVHFRPPAGVWLLKQMGVPAR
ncbi:MAG TPA: hypothetical protein VNX61_16290 [Rhizomicrobium sp.]|nr:hypothetical protein [Rhizomicrobium sp.]